MNSDTNFPNTNASSASSGGDCQRRSKRNHGPVRGTDHEERNNSAVAHAAREHTGNEERAKDERFGKPANAKNKSNNENLGSSIGLTGSQWPLLSVEWEGGRSGEASIQSVKRYRCR